LYFIIFYCLNTKIIALRINLKLSWITEYKSGCIWTFHWDQSIIFSFFYWTYTEFIHILYYFFIFYNKNFFCLNRNYTINTWHSHNRLLPFIKTCFNLYKAIWVFSCSCKNHYCFLFSEKSHSINSLSHCLLISIFHNYSYIFSIKHWIIYISMKPEI
jgi:hypothetical protein